MKLQLLTCPSTAGQVPVGATCDHRDDVGMQPSSQLCFMLLRVSVTACVLGHLLNTTKIRSKSLVSFPLEITNALNKKKKRIKFHICAHTQGSLQLFWIYIQWGCLLHSSPDKRCKSMSLHTQEQLGLADIPHSTGGAEQRSTRSTHCRQRRINPVPEAPCSSSP